MKPELLIPVLMNKLLFYTRLSIKKISFSEKREILIPKAEGLKTELKVRF